MNKTFEAWIRELQLVAKSLIIDLDAHDLNYNFYYTKGYTPSQLLNEIKDSKQGNTILLHDVKYSLLRGDNPIVEVLKQGDVGSAYSFNPESTVTETSSITSSFLKTKVFRRCINGVDTKIVMACDHELQELLGLQYEVFDQQEETIRLLRSSFKDKATDIELLCNSNTKLRKELDEFKNMTTWQCFTKWFNKLTTF